MVQKNKKDILIGINHFDKVGGSEMYTYTLSISLQKSGHSISIFTYNKGFVAEKLKAECPEICFLTDLELANKTFDIALISHNSIFNLPVNATHIIQICHGIFPALEQPSYLADSHISISKEIHEYLENKQFKSVFIPNPIDLERFTCKTLIGLELKSILSLCQGQEANELLQEVCDELGLVLRCHNKFNDPVWDLEKAINQADLVVSLGRGVIESMACGRSVLVFDHRGYNGSLADGIVTQENIQEIQKNNFSGRRFRHKPTKEYLIEELNKYNQSQGSFNQNYARNHFGVSSIITQIWEIQVTINPDLKSIMQDFYDSLDGRLMILKDSKPYFVKHNMKYYIKSWEEIQRIINRFGLIDLSIKLFQKHDLDDIPTVPFSHLSQAHRRKNELRRKIGMSNRKKLNTN